ncbi:MAG: protein translocase subunit SecF [Pseudomonadota bacterium]|nr:protein translocase subunit SecF [Pseudomonadota bacterium]
MDFFKTTPKIDFMGARRVAIGLSVVLFVLSFIAFGTRGLNFGIDFTGGTLIEVAYDRVVDLGEVREQLAAAGFDAAIVQHIGSAKGVIVRIPPHAGMQSAEISNRVLDALKKDTQASVEVRQVEFVGPQVGEELVEDGGLALIFALFGILVYVALRFELRLAVASVIATVHDLLLTTGLVSALGLQFDLTMLAAILTVAGYSINDTIVVFDRIRENFRRLRRESPLEVMNRSINETLSRTLITGPTSLMVVTALYFLGGDVIDDFALTLIIGVVIGTFSSIYIASPIALLLGVSRTDLMPVKKEGAGITEQP